MEVINAGMRKGIKTIAVVAQTMQFVSLMPKPKDFVMRVVGDVVYMSAQIKTLSDQMNKLLDSYAEIPGNYLMTQFNSITGSLTNITNRVGEYASNAVNQTLGLAENTMNEITGLSGMVIDTAGQLVNSVGGLVSAVGQSGGAVVDSFAGTDYSVSIHDGAEIVLEWTDNGFKNISSSATAPLIEATQKITDAKNKAIDKINDTTQNVTEGIEKAQKYVQELITKLRNYMKELESKIDGGFKKYTGMEAVGNAAGQVSQAITESGDNSNAGMAVGAVTESMAELIKNFSIGKVIAAFAGVLTQSVIVKTGLDQLPPIDFESMLCKIRDDISMTPNELYKKYNDLNKELDNVYTEFIQFGEESVKIPTEDRKYSSKNYKEFIKTYEGELKEQREKLRTLMKYSPNNRQGSKLITDDNGNVVVNADGQIINENGEDVSGHYDNLTKKELRSAIKEARKYRNQVKNAKQATTFKSIIGDELNNLMKEVEYRSNSIKADWESMLKQYKDAIKEIKSFFSGGGYCDMFIDDCCKQINKDCDDIKELCKNLITQLIGCAVKVCIPSDIGTVVPNPVYKIADFWMDLKTIFKFIKDLITLIIDIINNINKIARVILNGLNSLADIIKQIMDLIGLGWLMDLIQNVINIFGQRIDEAKISLENMISPVYFKDTDEYNHGMEALDEYLDSGNTDGTIVDDIEDLFIRAGMGDINFPKIKYYKRDNSDELEKLINEVEARGENIVAYKSPIISTSGDTDNVNDIINNGGKISKDIKFIGWNFYHPSLYHGDYGYGAGVGFGIINRIIKYIKSNIIKRASKNGHKKNGGVAYLKKSTRMVGKGTNYKTGKSNRVQAYDAFYWYTYYTEDLEKDCFEFGVSEKQTIIDSVVKTQNGSVVQVKDMDGNIRQVFVADNTVKTGDYVNVDGVRYRVVK